MRSQNFHKLMNSEEWLEMDIESEPALVEGFLPPEPGEYGLISGRTGIGKSIMAMHLGLCLATGTKFYGLECQKVVVGHLVMEGGRSNLKKRLAKIKEQYPATTNHRFELRAPFLFEKNIDGFKSTFEGCRVVILDNLKNLVTGEYMKSPYATNWIKKFQDTLTEIGAVGILTAHIRKPHDLLMEPGDVYSIKGCTEYVDSSSGVLLLERKRQGRNQGGRFQKRDDNEVVLYFAKHRVSDVELQPIELYRHYETISFKPADESLPIEKVYA